VNTRTNRSNGATGYLFPPLCLHRGLSATINILTSLGVSSVRTCSHSGRSTKWNERCVPTWSGSSIRSSVQYAQCRPVDVARLSISCPARFRRTWTLSSDGTSPTDAGAIHAPECESHQLQHWFFHTGFRSPRTLTERRTCHSETFDPRIPIFAPRYPRGLTLGLDLSRIIGIATNAS
jgi:hypothetical protein